MENQTTMSGYNPLVTRLRYDSALFGMHGFVMSAVGVRKIDTGIKLIPGIAMTGLTGGVLCENGPRFAFAQGRSMPTSRGSPPIYDD
jgi:hypothetical protein